MNCPRCETVILVEREREALIVDACPQCRGVWLDRGELEKLITRAVQEHEAYERPGRPGVPAQAPAYVNAGAPNPAASGHVGPAAQHHDRQSYPDYPPPSSDRRGAYGNPRGYAQPHSQQYPHGHGPHGKRKRHWLQTLGEIFD